MADFSRIRQAVSQASSERDRLTRQLAATTGQLAAARADLVAQQAASNQAAIDAALARIRDLVDERATIAGALGTLREDLRGTLDNILHADLALEGNVPLVLLPVRVETRSAAGGASLRVRIFPTTLHVKSLDEGLSESERTAGIAYWTAVWATGDTTSPWQALVAAAGARRAPWVAEALRPRNLAARPGAAPDFPDTLPRNGRP